MLAGKSPVHAAQSKDGGEEKTNHRLSFMLLPQTLQILGTALAGPLLHVLLALLQFLPHHHNGKV